MSVLDWLDLLFRHTGPIERAAHIHPISIGDKDDAVRIVQNALRASGSELVPDGEFGPITKTALERFQAAHHLPITGFVNDVTGRELDKLDVIRLPPSVSSTLADAPWVSDVRACTGIKEVPGAANSPIIMKWGEDIAHAFPEMTAYEKTYSGDDIAWCGWGMAGVMARHKIRPPFGSTPTTKFMWADSWRAPNWGQPLKEPITGCIMTFTRAGGGHVSMLEKIDGDTAYIRGFNQSDMVCVSAKKNWRATFTAATWPPGFKVTEIEGNINNAIASGSER